MNANDSTKKNDLRQSKFVNKQHKPKTQKETFEVNRIQIDEDMFKIHKRRSPRDQSHCSKYRNNRSPSLNIEIAETEPFETKTSLLGNLTQILGTASVKNTDRNKFKDFSKVMKGISLNKTYNTIRKELLSTKTNKFNHNPINPHSSNNININILINGDKSKSNRVNKRKVSFEKMKSLGDSSAKDDIDDPKSHSNVFDNIIKRLDDNKSRTSPQTGWFDKAKTSLHSTKKNSKLY